MEDILLETTIELNDIESLKYDKAVNEVMIKTKAKEHRYKIEETLETYILNYEQPLYINNLGKEIE